MPKPNNKQTTAIGKGARPQEMVAVRKHLPDVLQVPPISPTDTVAQASSPAGSGSVPLPGSTPVGTTGRPAAETAALRGFSFCAWTGEMLF